MKREGLSCTSCKQHLLTSVCWASGLLLKPRSENAAFWDLLLYQIWKFYVG